MKGIWFAKMALMVALFFTIMSGVVMYLWNWLFPTLFNLPLITFWQAAGLLLFSKIIFGFGKKGGSPYGGPNWKHKWSNLSEEQKNQWKEKLKEKWCQSPQETEKEKQEDAIS